MKKNKPILIGILGSTGLMLLYFSILTWANSKNHAIEQFKAMWYWFTILTIGFGIQLGLYSYIKSAKHKKTAGATAEIAATGGLTTGSMIACCAHHIADILPLLGFSAAAIFLIQYQIPFILLGIFSNVIGITMMLNIVQKNHLYKTSSVFSKIFILDMMKTRNIMIVISIIIVSISFIVAGN